jgi:hypothetical protein
MFGKQFSTVLAFGLILFASTSAFANPTPENEDLYGENLYQKVKVEAPDSIESESRNLAQKNDSPQSLTAKRNSKKRVTN